MTVQDIVSVHVFSTAVHILHIVNKQTKQCNINKNKGKNVPGSRSVGRKAAGERERRKNIRGLGKAREHLRIVLKTSFGNTSSY